MEELSKKRSRIPLQEAEIKKNGGLIPKKEIEASVIHAINPRVDRSC